MPPVPINYLAVLAAAVVSIVLGFVWFGPLFGKPWMALMGYTKADMEKAKAESKSMSTNYALMSLGSLVMAYVLAHALVFGDAYLNISGVSGGLMAGFWSWLGFIAPVVMGDQLWGKKPWKLYPITSGYYLVSLCLMGIVLALWK